MVFGFLLASVIWALGIVAQSPQPTQPPSQNQRASHTTNEASKGEDEKSIWKPSDPVSLYTLVLAFFSGALVIISAIQIRFLILADRTARISAIAARRAANAARNQVNIAEQSLVAGQRPWISIDIRINGDLIFDANGNARVHLLFILKNIGRSPATNVRINPYTFLHSPKRLDVLAEYQNFCAITQMRPDNMMTYTLFPEETKQIPRFETISSDQIIEACQAWKETTSQDWKFIAPNIVGCVSYKIAFDDKQHHTGFITELRRRRRADYPSGIEAGMFSLDEAKVAAADVLLFHSPRGSPSID